MSIKSVIARLWATSVAASSDWFDRLSNKEQEDYLKEHPHSRMKQRSYGHEEMSHQQKQDRLADLDRQRTHLRYQHNDVIQKHRDAKQAFQSLNAKPGPKTDEEKRQIDKHTRTYTSLHGHPAVMKLRQLDDERHHLQDLSDKKEAEMAKANPKLRKLLSQRWKAERDWTLAETKGMRDQHKAKYDELNRQISKLIDSKA